MRDNTSVLLREGTVTGSLPITGVTTFIKICIIVGYYIAKRVKTVFLLYSFNVGGTARMRP